jgi:RHS repeat-associated protein
MQYRLLFILFFVIGSLYATENNDGEKPPLAHIECEPSAVVNRAVNVISGAYCDHQVDLVIPGARPLTLERAYSSNDTNLGTLFHGWNLNHTSMIRDGFGSQVNRKSWPTLTDAFGASRGFQGRVGHNAGVYCKHKISPFYCNTGLTNTSSGEISGRTNLKNGIIYYRDYNGKCYYESGNGDKSIFKEFRNKRWHPVSKEFLKGDKLIYSYKKISEVYHMMPRRIEHQNIYSESLGFLEWEYFTSSHKNTSINVKSSDGRMVTYHFYSWKNDKDRYEYYLNRVVRPNAPEEKYIYKKKSNRIIRKERPEGHFLNIAYYQKGRNDVGGTNVKINEMDVSYHRVKFLESPVGTDETPIITSKYFYKPTSTEVFDALGNRTVYHHQLSRLISIEKYLNNGNLSTTEKLYWGRNTNVANLISRAFFKSDDSLHFCKNYEYDESGNVLVDRLYGNLSGWNTNTIEIDKYGEVTNLGCEVFPKIFRYNAKNLMTWEQDNRKIIQYHYVEQTDLLKNKLIYSANRLEKRNYYLYDIKGNLLTEITDNGSEYDLNDLRGVTERHIKRITPQNTAPFGFPQIVEEYYLDLNTNTECLLKKTVNHYSSIGKLIQRDRYDSQNTFVYSEYWDYDSLGNQILAVDALGQSTNKKYDANCNLIFEQGPKTDFHKEFVYDFADRLIREEIIQEDGLHLATSHKYDHEGNRIATVDHYGNETKFDYDEFHRTTKCHLPHVYDENQNVEIPEIITEYDVMSHPTKVINPRGIMTKTKYNVHGKPIFIENQDGTKQKNTYNLDGTLKESIDTNGLITRFTYDFQERVIEKEIFSPEGTFLESSSYTYDAFHLLSEKETDGMTTLYKYDGAGRLVEKLRGTSRICYLHDSLGRISEERNYYNENAYTVKSMDYDLLNRIIEERVQECDGTILRRVGFGYDSQGNRNETIQYYESAPSITKTQYNFQGKPLEITDALGNTTTFYYDYQHLNDLGQVVGYEEVIDSCGGISTTEFDAIGRVACSQRKSLFGNIIQERKFFYDLSGNLAKQVDRILSSGKEDRYAITKWKYDSANREIECIEAFEEPEQKITRTLYNEKGQKRIIIKPDGVKIVFGYDVYGRLQNYYSTDKSFHYTYTYDARGNPICVSDEINHMSTKQEFDEENRMVKETLGNGLSVSYRYDSQNRPIQITLPDQTSIEYTYDAMDMKQIHRIGKNHDFKFNYHHYDLRGNLIDSDNSNLKYDFMGRITDIISPHWKSEDLRYDKLGNLVYRMIKDGAGSRSFYYSYDDLQQIQKEEGDIAHSYTYDSLYNRLQKDDKVDSFNALHQIVDPCFAYDLNGCLIKKDEAVFGYDALNRMTSVIKGSNKYEYRYDESNRRIVKYIYTSDADSWQLTRTIRYLYTGANEIGCVEGDNIIELRILGIGRGAELGAAVALEFDNRVFIPTHDHNGNVVSLADLEGNLYENYRFTAFGEETIYDATGSEKNGSINPWRFSSKRVDEETGLIFFGRRYYDSDKGRWMSQDPAGFAEGPNLYAYVSNNPLTHVDLYGLMMSGNHSYLCQAIQYFGAGLQMLGDHLIPIPLIRDVVSLTGHILANRNVKNFYPSSQYPHSENSTTDGPEGTSEDRQLVMNGMLTTYDEAHANAKSVSKAYGGIAIHYVYNATHGFISDIMEIVAQHLGLPTRSVDKAVEHIRHSIDLAGGVNSGHKVTIHAHSQGGLILYRALQHLTAEEKKMLHVNTYGSAQMISSEGLGSARNFVNTRDPVPFISDLFGQIKGSFSPHYDIQRLPSSPFSVFDHDFTKGNYWSKIEGSGNDYINSYGKATI